MRAPLVLMFDAKPSVGEAMMHMEECWLLCRRMLQVRRSSVLGAVRGRASFSRLTALTLLCRRGCTSRTTPRNRAESSLSRSVRARGNFERRPPG